ncbi:hypothetical protein PybrP1_004382 [[Pythium] brassicae (nom. inval.)]|nr:hypothetical protein PybrP1_004382 [[Pythium] brassicae (nom. inval.)]
MALDMLTSEQIQDLDSNLLNIDEFFANNADDEDHEDIWATPRQNSDEHGDVDEDWFASTLDPLVHDVDDTVFVQIKQLSPAKSVQQKAQSGTAEDGSDKKCDNIKAEPCYASHDDEEMQDATAYNEGDTGDAAGGCQDSCGCYTPGDVQSDAANLLDDAGWLDFDRSPLTSPSMPLRELSRERLLVSPPTKQEEHFLVQDESDFSLPELTDDDMSALKDIPDMVDLFNSMHSPSEAARTSAARSIGTGATVAQPSLTSPTAATSGPTLSIRVPAPQTYPTSFSPSSTSAEGATKIGGPAPPQTAPLAAGPSSSSTSTASVNQFDYFTPPGYPNDGRYAGGASQLSASMFGSAALSPAAKSAGLPSGVVSTPQSRAAYAQVQGYAAAAAAAVAMASSAAAINTMRKLNTTYGVPIAPLQRALHPELKPKAPHSATHTTATGTKTLIAAATASVAASKLTKISITPDISDFKLVQIFHNFCDPASKLVDLPLFHQLLLHHQGKDDSHAAAVPAKTASSAAGSSSSAAKPLAISQETQRLFKALDPKGTGVLDVERFMSSFQICNRCTEAKRRAQSAGQSHPVASTAVERQLMEDVAPVIVRVVPTSYEGSKVKSCEHYQWTWCEGFEKTGNEKCRGTNRHDKCPKYLANCTLWKHKLPPKNRKAKVPEHLESPSKKLKHFA